MLCCVVLCCEINNTHTRSPQGAPSATAAGAVAGAAADDDDDEDDAPIVYLRVNDRWQVAVSVSDGSFDQVSFVNSICTVKGGQHVQYIADQVAAEACKKANKKNKGMQIRPHHVRNHLRLFVNCLIENPAFDSQVTSLHVYYTS